MTIREHPLAWRWTDSRYALFPEDILAQIEPVDLRRAEDLFRHSLRLLGRDGLSPEAFETVVRSRADIPTGAGCAWLRAQQPDLLRKSIRLLGEERRSADDVGDFQLPLG